MQEDNMKKILIEVAKVCGIDISNKELENVENGVELIRGKLNQTIFPELEEVMLPKWVINNFSKKDILAKTSLFNPLKSDWVIIGGLRGSRTALTDSSGLLLASQMCGALDFWIKGTGGITFPSKLDEEEAVLHLTSPEDQIYIWTWQTGSIEFTRYIYYVRKEQQEAIYNEVVIRNRGLEPARFTFFAVVRPVSVRGMEPLTTVKYDDNNLIVLANNHVAMRFDKKPDAVVMGAANDPNLLQEIQQEKRVDEEFEDRHGLATVALRFDVNLSPTSSRSFFFVQPLDAIPVGNIPNFWMNEEARFQTIGEWFDFMEDTAKISVPDSRIEKALTAAKAVIACQARKALFDGSFQFSGIDKARLFVALSQIGDLETGKILGIELAKSKREDLPTKIEELAALTWGILQPWVFDRNLKKAISLRDFLEFVGGKLAHKMEKTLQIERLKSRPVVLEKNGNISSSCDEASDDIATGKVVDTANKVEEDASFTPDHSWLLEAIWLVNSATLLYKTFESIGKVDLSHELQKLVESYRKLIIKNSKEIVQSFERAEDNDAKNLLGTVLKLISTVTLLGLEAFDQSVLKKCEVHFKNSLLRKGNVVAPDDQNKIALFLMLQLAQLYSLQHNSDVVDMILQKVRAYISRYFQLLDVVPLSEETYANPNHCLKSSIELILLIRKMILMEDNDNLIIAGGIPEEWFTTAQDLIFSNILTPKGRVSVEIGTSANQHQIDVRMEGLPEELIVHVPTSRSIKMFKVYGGGAPRRVADDVSPHLRIVPLSEHVIVIFHK